MNRILAIESSCDENSAAILVDGRVQSLVTVTQQVHHRWGGVVPELAGRSHLELQDGIVYEALTRANVGLDELTALAATTGPGLVGSLLVGRSYAEGLSSALNLPLLSVHHMEAHLWSVELDRDELALPLLVLLVSGGHTLLVLVRAFRDYEILGQTRDDALGEAYDKIGKLLGLRFPAGAEIDRLAANGDPRALRFPVAMRDDSLDFSYSGLKTAVANLLRRQPEWSQAERLPDLFASFQFAAVQSALAKVKLALSRARVKTLAAAGGVAANSALRAGLLTLANEHSLVFTAPALKYCADNAAMIGYVAYKELRRHAAPIGAVVRPRWPLTDLRNDGSNTH